jgi:hypothetical protein
VGTVIHGQANADAKAALMVKAVSSRNVLRVIDSTSVRPIQQRAVAVANAFDHQGSAGVEITTLERAVSSKNAPTTAGTGASVTRPQVHALANADIQVLHAASGNAPRTATEMVGATSSQDGAIVSAGTAGVLASLTNLAGP